jgi:hypothetical protein
MASDIAPKQSTEPSADREENLQNTATYLDRAAVSGLSQDHQQYLFQRHGTLELDPIPGIGGADPYNWPQWKVSFTTCLGPIIMSNVHGVCCRK